MKENLKRQELHIHQTEKCDFQMDSNVNSKTFNQIYSENFKNIQSKNNVV
jgi:hypothetical protein